MACQSAPAGMQAMHQWAIQQHDFLGSRAQVFDASYILVLLPGHLQKAMGATWQHEYVAFWQHDLVVEKGNKRSLGYVHNAEKFSQVH